MMTSWRPWRAETRVVTPVRARVKAVWSVMSTSAIVTPASRRALVREREVFGRIRAMTGIEELRRLRAMREPRVPVAPATAMKGWGVGVRVGDGIVRWKE